MESLDVAFSLCMIDRREESITAIKEEDEEEVKNRSILQELIRVGVLGVFREWIEDMCYLISSSSSSCSSSSSSQSSEREVNSKVLDEASQELMDHILDFLYELPVSRQHLKDSAIVKSLVKVLKISSFSMFFKKVTRLISHWTVKCNLSTPSFSTSSSSSSRNHMHATPATRSGGTEDQKGVRDIIGMKLRVPS
jgi:hypothetical protein